MLAPLAPTPNPSRKREGDKTSNPPLKGRGTTEGGGGAGEGGPFRFKVSVIPALDLER